MSASLIGAPEWLVDVYDVRRLGPDLLTEMEYVDGLTLEAFACSREFLGVSGDLSVYVAASILRAIAFMHAAHDPQGQSLGLVHRDLNPSNVLISRAGAVKVADFGCIKGRGRRFETMADGGPQLIGTPRYIAPEQCRGEGVSGKADVYAIRVMLHEMVSRGEHPTLPRKTTNDCDALLACEPTPLRKMAGGFQRGLTDSVDAMLKRNPAERPDAEQALELLMGSPRLEGLQAQRLLSKRVNRVLDASSTAGTRADDLQLRP